MNLDKAKYKDNTEELPACSSVEECQAFLAKASKDYLAGTIEYDDYKKAKSKYGANYSKTILDSTSIFAYLGSITNSLKNSIVGIFKPLQYKSTESE
ncbi:MAG: hypothetical protein AAGE84_29660 [Cyanobacteria bacterium P01_G01_bin.39]